MSHNWGYVNAKKMAKENGMKGASKVEVKGHTRSARSGKSPPPDAAPTSKDIPQNRVVKKAKGGKVTASKGKC